MRLLLLEDDIGLSKALEKLLIANGYAVDCVTLVNHAKLALAENSYDIVILDRMLPDGDGIEILDFCKEHKIQNRYIVLSALSDLQEKVNGLDLGADDYIAKPFEPVELLARLRVALRRDIEEDKDSIELQNLTYYPGNREFEVEGKSFILPRKEHMVLELLIKRFNRVVPREALEENMYSFDTEITSNSLESHVSKLRKNLAKCNVKLSIGTIWGIGYILKNLDP